MRPQVAYPGPIYTPPVVVGKTIQLVLNTTDTIDLFFTATGGTTAYKTAQSTDNGTIRNYSWTQEAYRGRLYCESSNLVPLLLNLVLSVRNLIQNIIRLGYVEQGSDLVNGDELNAHHGPILQAILAGDADAARQAMLDHLNYSATLMLALAERPLPEDTRELTSEA